MQVKFIFSRKVLYLASFWKREFLNLGKVRAASLRSNFHFLSQVLQEEEEILWERNVVLADEKLKRAQRPMYEFTGVIKV